MRKCLNCDAEIEGRADRQYCSDTCSKRARRVVEKYNASSITIRKDAKFDWEIVASLSLKYPLIDSDFIKRGIQSCRESDTDIDYFIKQYLDGDKSIPINKAMDQAHRALLSKGF